MQPKAIASAHGTASRINVECATNSARSCCVRSEDSDLPWRCYYADTVRIERIKIRKPGRRVVALALQALVALGLVVAPVGAQESILSVTVFDEKTGETVTGLGPERFEARDGDTALRVDSVREPREPLDILLLMDTSIVGDAVRPIASALIDQLHPDETMALVGFDEGAELLQDFTSEKRLLDTALDRIEYGNTPRVQDALFAAIDGGFESSSGRRTIILLSAGVVARSGVAEAEVIQRARVKRVSIHTVFVRNDARSLLRRLALRAGGASFGAKRLKLDPRPLSKRVIEAIRSPYELTVSGVFALGDRISVAVSSVAGAKEKLTASALPLE